MPHGRRPQGASTGKCCPGTTVKHQSDVHSTSISRQQSPGRANALSFSARITFNPKTRELAQMATKKLTFRSINLGEDVALMLCFTPPTPELFVKQFPIAWRVTTLAAKGRSVLEATWTSTLGFCMPQIGGNTRLVSAGTYTPIKIGEITTLTVNEKASPPAYHFTDPIPLAGTHNVQAVNNTGHPSTIGLGFVSNLGAVNESMSPVLSWNAVGNGLSVTGEFTPILRAYVALKYQESDIIRGEIQAIKPIWEKNLLTLGPSTEIIISKDAAGAYVATDSTGSSLYQDASFEGDGELSVDVKKDPGAGPLVNEIAFRQTPSAGGKLQLYKADLAFTSAKVALPAARAIGEKLYGQGYKAKFLYKDGNDEARLELTLPLGVSCQDAEREVLAALDSDQRVVRNVNIKGHSGEVFIFAGPYARWNEINPSTSEWHRSGKVLLGRSINGSGGGLYAENDDDDVAGTVPASAALLAVENYGAARTRTVSRKPSTAYLAN